MPLYRSSNVSPKSGYGFSSGPQRATWPPQKPLPLALRITTLISLSRSASCRQASTSCTSVASLVLALSGRLRMIRAIGGSRS